MEEAERMATLLIDEEEQAKQKALHKVYIHETAPYMRLQQVDIAPILL